MSNFLHIFQLYDLIDKKLKRALPKAKYGKAMKKVDNMIGLIYGSVTGLMCGVATQSIGAKVAEQRFKSEVPYCSVKDSIAVNDPILGQLLSHVAEFKHAKWDPAKFKAATNYRSVICNFTSTKVDLQPQLVEQVRTGKSAQLYNLSGEDFYLRVPLCTLFGDSTIDVVIGKVLQTHTAFEAPAYALLTASIIQLTLLNDDIFINVLDWNQIIKEKLIPLLGEYYKIYTNSCIGGLPNKSEADKLRIDSMKLRLDEQYKSIQDQLNSALNMFAVPNVDKIDESKTEINENTDHLSEDEKEEFKITKLFTKELDLLNLSVKHISHPMLLAIWCVKALTKVHEVFGIDNIEPGHISELMLKSVAIKAGMSAYNTMIVGSILGCVFGCTQVPEMFYEAMDDKLMDRINRDVLDIIASM